ncbi:MAG: DMT family transporter [Nanoarchaeota archaeon]|nr:DMT family transporter [Nanoarchaeota archaeon]
MILSPLFAAVGSALETNLSKKILQKATISSYTFSYFMIVSIIQLPLLFFNQLSVTFAFLSLGGGILIFLANRLYFYALTLNDVSDIAPLKVISALTAAILGYIFLKDERLPWQTYIILAAILFSIYLLYSSKGKFFSSLLSKSSVLAMVSMVIWGIFYTYLKFATTLANPLFLYWGFGLVFLLCTILFTALKKEKLRYIPDTEIKLFGREMPLRLVFLVTAAIILLEYYILYTSVASFSSTICVILYNTDILFMTLLSLVFFKAKIGVSKWLSIGLASLSIIALQMYM